MDPAVWFQEDMIMDCKLRAKNCGGCPMLATEYAAQLKKKEADVRALLGKYGPVAPIRGMETPYHYRMFYSFIDFIIKTYSQYNQVSLVDLCTFLKNNAFYHC